MGDASSSNKSCTSGQVNNSFLGNNHHNYYKQKNLETQRLQLLKKTSPVDELLKKIQPSLSEREWIINQRQRNVSSMYTKGIIAMEMRNAVDVVRQWCQEEAWYVRKGLRKITTADTADRSPVLSPTRPKCNFTVDSILVTYHGLFLTYRQ